MEDLLRLGVALGVFFSMVAWELFSPRRVLSLSRLQRWPVNIGLASLNMLFVRFTLGSIAYLSAVKANEFGWGLLNVFVLTEWLRVAMTLIGLDLAIYAQHVLMHKWSFLWRLHQVHHTDLDFDATTAVRFHPLEIILSLFYKVLCIYVLGADPSAVIAFEIILNATATFNHSNINIPDVFDKKLRYLIVTPDMHRIHHSALKVETDSNYGFSISCWDRLFRTYTAMPQQAQLSMSIGLQKFRAASELNFAALLSLPFKSLF